MNRLRGSTLAMVRGIVTGLIWGSIVGFGVITVANEFAAPVLLSSGSTDVTADASGETPGTVAPDVHVPDGNPVMSDVDAVPELQPQMEAAEPDRSAAQPDVPDPVVAPEAAPEIPNVQGNAPKPHVEAPKTAMNASQNQTEVVEQATTPETPVVTSPQSAAPHASTADTPPSVTSRLPSVASTSANNHRVISPKPPQEGPASQPSSPQTTPPSAINPTPATGGLVSSQPAPQEPQSPAAPKGPAQPGMAQAAPQSEVIDDVETQALAEPKSVMVGTQESAFEPVSDVPLGEKVSSFTEREDTRISSRLPTASEASAPVVVAEDLPALLVNAAEYRGDKTGPMISVILVDVGEIGPDDDAISSLPFPATFAVDALATGAEDRAVSYRNKGFEVLSMVAIPDGATAQDAAVTLSEVRELVSVSVGFLDVPAASFQANRDIAAQVIATAVETGHGVVTFPRGLNALEQEATRAKAHAALVFRDIDGKGQNGAAIKRFLDQAAFRAGIDGEILLLGRSQPETLKALAEWSLGTRAANVSLVPLSTLLMVEE